MTRRSLVAAVLVLVAASPALTPAAPVAAGEPTDRLRTLFDRANGVLLAPEPDAGLEDRRGAVRALLTDVFDVNGAAALALGRHWDAMPAPTREAFTRLYADLVERGYLAWVGGKARFGEGGVSVRWLDERVEDDAATVASVLLTRTGAELPIDYRMARRGTEWLVRDVVVDGVSLAANYRVQVERVMQLGSYEELLARLVDKAGPAARAAVAAVTPTPIVVAELREPTAVLSADATPAAAPAPPAAPSPEPATMSATSISATTTGATPIAPETTNATLVPPKAVASVARSTAPASEPRPLFWVQVGAFRTVEAATQAVRRVRQYAVTIAVGGDRRAPLTRVLLGPFAEHATAASTVRALHARGIAAFVAEPPH